MWIQSQNARANYEMNSNILLSSSDPNDINRNGREEEEKNNVKRRWCYSLGWLANKCMTSSGLFIWGYYYSWNLKLNLSQLALALSSQMQLPILCPHDKRTNEWARRHNGEKKVELRRKIDMAEVNVSAFYSLVFQYLKVPFFSCYCLRMRRYNMSALNSIDTQTIGDGEHNNGETFAELRSQVSVCYVNSMFGKAFHSAIFIGSFHDYREQWESKRARRCTKLSIFDEFNGRNLADDMFMFAERVCVWDC